MEVWDIVILLCLSLSSSHMCESTQAATQTGVKIAHTRLYKWKTEGRPNPTELNQSGLGWTGRTEGFNIYNEEMKKFQEKNAVKECHLPRPSDELEYFADSRSSSSFPVNSIHQYSHSPITTFKWKQVMPSTN